MRIPSVARTPLALGLASTLVLAGCSGAAEGESEPEESVSSSATTSAEAEAEEPYLKVPDGVELTAPGEVLEFGSTATVAFETARTQKKKKGTKVGVLDVTVQRVDQGDIKDLIDFKLGKKLKKSQVYYVRAKVENVGRTNLTGAFPPIYVEDGEEHLVEASQFKSLFKACPSPVLPKGFKKGKKTTGCWVYLVADGDAGAVSFYPYEGFLPVEWTGPINKPKAAKKNTKQGNNKQDDKKQQGDEGADG